MLNGILSSFSHGEEGEVLDAGDTWEYLYVLNRKRLVSAVLDPDVAQGKRSFLAGRLAVSIVVGSVLPLRSLVWMFNRV